MKGSLEHEKSVTVSGVVTVDSVTVTDKVCISNHVHHDLSEAFPSAS